MGILYSIFYEEPVITEKTKKCRVTFNTKASVRNPSNEEGIYIITDIPTKKGKPYKTQEERDAGVREEDILFVFMHLIVDWSNSCQNNGIIAGAIRKATETREKKTERVIKQPSSEELLAQCTSLIDRLSSGNVTLAGRAGRIMVKNEESVDFIDRKNIERLKLAIPQAIGKLTYI